MTNMKCARCGVIFEAGKTYGRYCQYGADCGPIEMIAPKLFRNIIYNPSPSVDMAFPPLGFVTQAEHDLVKAALADMTRQRDEARAEVFTTLADGQIVAACSAMTDAMIKSGSGTKKFHLWGKKEQEAAMKFMRVAVRALAEGEKP